MKSPDNFLSSSEQKAENRNILLMKSRNLSLKSIQFMGICQALCGHIFAIRAQIDQSEVCIWQITLIRFAKISPKTVLMAKLFQNNSNLNNFDYSRRVSNDQKN